MCRYLEHDDSIDLTRFIAFQLTSFLYYYPVFCYAHSFAMLSFCSEEDKMNVETKMIFDQYISVIKIVIENKIMYANDNVTKRSTVIERNCDQIFIYVLLTHDVEQGVIKCIRFC